VDLDNIIRVFFDPEIIVQVLPGILTTGLVNTLILTVFSLLAGLVLGLVVAMCLLARTRWLRWPARVWVDVFRGLPALLTIFIVGIGLPIAGIDVFGRNTFPYAIVAIGMIQSAYIGEIFRSGIQSVAPGQMEAARSLGMPFWSAMWHVTIPQGVRRVLPALTGQAIITVKETALVYVLGLMPSQQDLFSLAQSGSSQFASMTPVVVAGAVYLVLTIPLTHIVNRFDRRMREGKRERLTVRTTTEVIPTLASEA
jgi:polar amino acid transport system permease protein